MAKSKDFSPKYNAPFELHYPVNNQWLTALNTVLERDVSNYFAVGQRKQLWLRTMSPMLDYICGRGLPIGKLVEIHGEKDRGKTTLLYIIMAGLSQIGKHVLYIDMEGKASLEYLESFGADFNYIHTMIPRTGEEMLDIVIATLQMPYELQPAMIGVDSFASMPTVEEVEGDMQGRGFSGSAMLWTRFSKVITYDLAKSNTVLVGTNQMRDRMGGFQPMGSDGKKPAGPNVLEHRPSVSIKMRSIYRGNSKDDKNPMDDDEFIITYYNVKNHSSKSRDTNDGSGKFGTKINQEPYVHVDRAFEFTELGKRLGVLTNKDGDPLPNFSSTAYFGDYELGRGRQNVVDFLMNNQHFMEGQFCEAVYEEMGKKPVHQNQYAPNIEIPEEDEFEPPIVEIVNDLEV